MCLLSFLKWGSIGYPLRIVQWDFTRRDHPGNPGRVSGSGPVILRQLRTTQARISIWSLLASSSTHRDTFIRALIQIRVDIATTPRGLVHFLTTDRATCIVFSDDDLPPEGLDHVRPLFIDVACSSRRVLPVLLDNGSA